MGAAEPDGPGRACRRASGGSRCRRRRSRGAAAAETVSGAGHDVGALASRVPGALLFVPLVEGESHSPVEVVRAEDVALALDVLLRRRSARGRAARTRRPTAPPEPRPAGSGSGSWARRGGSPPGRVHVSAATRHAYSSSGSSRAVSKAWIASRRRAPRAWRCASAPAVKASPAPTVSTTRTVGAGTAAAAEDVVARAPPAPAVTMTRATPAASQRATMSASPRVRIQPRDVLLARLDDVDQRHPSLEPAHVRLPVGDQARADVGVQAEQPAARLLPEQSLEGRGDRLEDEGDRSDVQGRAGRERPSSGSCSRCAGRRPLSAAPSAWKVYVAWPSARWTTASVERSSATRKCVGRTPALVKWSRSSRPNGSLESLARNAVGTSSRPRPTATLRHDPPGCGS